MYSDVIIEEYKLFTDYFEVDGQKMLEKLGDKYFDSWEKNVHIEGTEEYLNNESKIMEQGQ